MFVTILIENTVLILLPQGVSYDHSKYVTWIHKVGFAVLRNLFERVLKLVIQQ